MAAYNEEKRAIIDKRLICIQTREWACALVNSKNIWAWIESKNISYLNFSLFSFTLFYLISHFNLYACVCVCAYMCAYVFYLLRSCCCWVEVVFSLTLYMLQSITMIIIINDRKKEIERREREKDRQSEMKIKVSLSFRFLYLVYQASSSHRRRRCCCCCC